jgi:hypothetical protein
MGILEYKRSRLKLITSGVVFIIILSFASVLLSAQNASDVPLRRDILLVRLGNEEAPIRTSTTIERFLNNIDELMMDSGTHDVDFTWKNSNSVRISTQCTQYIQRETPKSKLTTEIVQSSISSFGSDISHFKASIIIVVGHGSEFGIACESDSDNQVSWEEVVETTTKVQPQLTILASCFSSNAISFGSNIIGFSGVVDALLVGYVVSLLLTQVIPNTPNSVFEDTLDSALYRSEVLMHDETSLLPLSIQSDWASIRVPVVAILTGIFFIAGYHTLWATQGGLASVLAAIVVGAAGVVIGGLFQMAIEIIRNTVGVLIQAINRDMGKIFNATIGAILGFIISYGTPFLLPSFISSLAYIISGTTAALVLANTPIPWIRLAACAAAAIGIISIIDCFIQFL